jgi:hypothetical protein
MVMTVEPQVEAVQDAGVTGAAGAAGAGAGEDDDIPPPQAFKAAISKAHVAAGNHRRRLTCALIAHGERSIGKSSLVLVLTMSAGSFQYGYGQNRREAATCPVKICRTADAWLRRVRGDASGYDGGKQIHDKNNEQHDAMQYDGSSGSQGNSRDEQRQDQQHS